MNEGIFENNKVKSYIKAQKFYFLAEQCLNLIQKSLIPLLKEHGLHHSQYLILVVLRYAEMSGNEVMSTHISYLLGLEKHSVTTVIDSLCKKDYVERERSKTDRRVVFLKLTSAGKILIEKIQPETFESVSVFPDCSEEEFSGLISFLENLREMTALNNNQQPEVYRDAYERLLLKGEEEFLKVYGGQKESGEIGPDKTDG